MERLSVVLRDSLSPRNPKELILKHFFELPGLQQSGLEDRRYSDNLYAVISKATNLLSQTGQTKNRFRRLYIFCKYPDAIQAVCKGDNSPPILGDPFSAKLTGPVHTYSITRTRASTRPLHNTTPEDGLNRRCQCQARCRKISVLHGMNRRMCLLTHHIVPQQPQQRYHQNSLPQNDPRFHQTD